MTFNLLLSHMTHKAKKHIDDVMPLLKRKFQGNEDGLWTDEQVKCMLDSVQTSVLSEFASKAARVRTEKVTSILGTAVVKASLQRSITLKFDDGSSVCKELSIGESLYIGRIAKAHTDVTFCHVFNDEVDTVWRKVSALHCNLKNEGDGVKLRDTSTNGTWVNDTKIEKDTAIKLENTDKVKLYNANGEQTVASAQFTVSSS